MLRHLFDFLDYGLVLKKINSVNQAQCEWKLLTIKGDSSKTAD